MKNAQIKLLSVFTCYVKSFIFNICLTGSVVGEKIAINSVILILIGIYFNSNSTI